MDLDLIRAKQDSIVRCVERVRSKSGMSIADLVADYDAQDVIVLNLERAVQQAVDIAAHLLADTTEPVPESMRETFDILARIGTLTTDTADRMKKAVGFRNTAVHAYRAIDWDIVHHIVAERLDDFQAFIREVDTAICR